MNETIRAELLPGTALCGSKYVIEKKIGAGGFGITYIAKHATLEKRYAIKEFFLSGYNVRNSVTNHISLQGIETQDFEKFRLRFIEEAKTLAALNNESVVKVIDIFDENGTSYMVMPFIEGVTLQNLVEKNGPMDYEMAVNYIVQVCEALSYIHSKNILHRDVTPDNIIVTPYQKIVLIDFGSARKFIDNKTQRHTTIVKKGYAPLEQYSATSRKGAYTDLYSLGAVFYYILTGERPMDATERTLEKIKEPIEINPNVPEQINAVIMKAMDMDSENRYQTATDLTEDIFSGKFPKKPKPKKEKKENKDNKSLKKIAVYFSVAAIAVFAIVGIVFFASEQKKEQVERDNRAYSTLLYDVESDMKELNDPETDVRRLDSAAVIASKYSKSKYKDRFSADITKLKDEYTTRLSKKQIDLTNQIVDLYHLYNKSSKESKDKYRSIILNNIEEVQIINKILGQKDSTVILDINKYFTNE